MIAIAPKQNAEATTARMPARRRAAGARGRWTTFVLRTPVFALGAARRGRRTTFALRAPVFALGAARRAHAAPAAGGRSADFGRNALHTASSVSM